MFTTPTQRKNNLEEVNVSITIIKVPTLIFVATLITSTTQIMIFSVTHEFGISQCYSCLLSISLFTNHGRIGCLDTIEQTPLVGKKRH